MVDTKDLHAYCSGSVYHLQMLLYDHRSLCKYGEYQAINFGLGKG
ncbi:hypothetical protein [Sporolactobacillus shoreicorticis]|nr:hypothetical protein [Sporolactobacillus shoreicorticis]